MPRLPSNTLRVYIERLDDEYRVTWALNGALHEARFSPTPLESNDDFRRRIADEIAREATAAFMEEINVTQTH